MMRKYHVRFGGGRLEKGPSGYLVSRLPNNIDRKQFMPGKRSDCFFFRDAEVASASHFIVELSNISCWFFFLFQH